ncbi:MAG: DNA polymerase III subunit epsilon [Actinobacteria bacterium]|nr:DNA polymerase III subunit epsilon [Actinomycetota bacterium]MCG2801577.1 DNA polymerase III subunit epsilon [Cellulomonas sp.]
MDWRDTAMLGFDTETTGVDVETDRIVTAALVHRDGTGTSVRTWLIDPGVEIPPAATAIHGISTQQAREQGLEPAVALEQIAAELSGSLAAGVPVVAYNAAFDLRLLDAELRRHGLATLPDRLGRPTGPVIDPLVLDRAEDRFRRGKRRLGDLCGFYGVVESGSLHSADVDVVATLDVLGAILDRYPHLAAMSLEELHARQIDAHREWAEEFNAWRLSQGLDGPGADVTWPVRTPVGTLW